MKKMRDLLIILAIYLLAYVVGVVPAIFIENVILKVFVFDVVATAVTFVFSVALRNSSVYDAYWSLTPMIASIWLMLDAQAFSVWQIIFFVVFNVWGTRLTVNWIIVFTDFSYEDWRYTKFRDENKPLMWFIINLFGIHYVPTFVVFGGMLPLFEIATNPLGPLSLVGDALILCGVAFEFFADRQMHAFLATTTEKVTCSRGLWNFSRHPNYLGEITVWVGTFVAMIFYAPDKWYYAVGALAVFVLFNVVSIPLMEKRQLARRSDYADYRKTTSRLFLLPKKIG